MISFPKYSESTLKCVLFAEYKVQPISVTMILLSILFELLVA